MLLVLGGLGWWWWQPPPSAYELAGREIEAYQAAHAQRPLSAYDKLMEQALGRIEARIEELGLRQVNGKPVYPQLLFFPARLHRIRLGWSYEFGDRVFVPEAGPRGQMIYTPENAFGLEIRAEWITDDLRHQAELESLRETLRTRLAAPDAEFGTLQDPRLDPVRQGVAAGAPVIPGEARINADMWFDLDDEPNQQLYGRVRTIIREEAERIRPALEKFVPTHGTPTLAD